MTDVARLYVAAAIDATTAGQRYVAAAAPFDWNDLIDVIQKLVPEAKVASHLGNATDDLGENDNAPGAALLEKWWGQKGFTGFEETIKQNLDADL